MNPLPGVEALFPEGGQPGVVALALLAAATLVSEDLACLAAGLLVAQGRLGFGAGSLACGAGILAGDFALFWAGRLLGRPLLERAPLRWLLSRRDAEEGARWLRRRGAVVILLSRFLPGTRLPTYVAAGLLDTPFATFALWFGVAVLLWTPLLVGLGTVAGASAAAAFAAYERYTLVVAGALLVLVWLGRRALPALASAGGRARLRARCGRLRWEYWPWPLFYLPVGVWIAWLALRHRSLTLFTAANPAIPAGGFVGESKAEILARLPGDRVARWQRLPAALAPEARVGRVRAFLVAHGLDLPVVLKPDTGERGRGVTICRSWEEVSRCLTAARADYLAQEWVDGPELGVFYVRLPGEAKGWILSVTEKLLPRVTGNGRATLGELILADTVASRQAPLFAGRLGRRWEGVPPAGLVVALADVGNHCRGAVFRDGEAAWRTPALEAAVDEMGRSFEGFFFGRFDLRGPSAEALRDGRDLKVLELNGVTSEATHIYDSETRLWDAYAALFRQWTLAFEVGRRNRARGTPPSTARELARLWFAWRRGAAAGPARRAPVGPSGEEQARGDPPPLSGTAGKSPAAPSSPWA